MKGEISKFCSVRWTNSGMVWRGEYSMQNTLEHHKDAGESSLSQVLETSAPLKYFLTTQEIQSLLERAWARKKSLPEDLHSAMESQQRTLSSMPELEESLLQDRKQKATEMTTKPTPLTQEEPLMLSVRRMLPSEYEQLQGFPAGWTEIDTEL